MPVYELVVPMHVTAGVYIVADSEDRAVEMFRNDANVWNEAFDCIDKDAQAILENGEVLKQDAHAYEVDTALVKAQTFPVQTPIGCKRAQCVFPSKCGC